ncbi:hypothetical protein ACQU0X_25605 [Pseudovibrio ascidiaceicola]|uniref:hypothetical protein n=1 Tax=Pseudovibrio ascidiaceicola TaxID=285279 RepID=UPI003D36B1EB
MFVSLLQPSLPPFSSNPNKKKTMLETENTPACITMRNEVIQTLAQSGFIKHNTGGDVFSWCLSRNAPDNDQFLIFVDEKKSMDIGDDERLYADPNAPVWIMARHNRNGDGFIEIDSLTLSEAIKNVSELPEPNGKYSFSGSSGFQVARQVRSGLKHFEAALTSPKKAAPGGLCSFSSGQKAT